MLKLSVENLVELHSIVTQAQYADPWKKAHFPAQVANLLIQNTTRGDLPTRAAHLGFALQTGQYFRDGNTRTGCAALVSVLCLEGRSLKTSTLALYAQLGYYGQRGQTTNGQLDPFTNWVSSNVYGHNNANKAQSDGVPFQSQAYSDWDHVLTELQTVQTDVDGLLDSYKNRRTVSGTWTAQKKKMLKTWSKNRGYGIPDWSV